MRVRGHLRGDVVSTLLPAGYGGGNSTLTATVAEQLAEPAENFDVDPEETFLRHVSDLAAVHACFERYGVVGVTGVLSPEECQALITLGLEPHLPEGCHMDDVDTFHMADQGLNRYGVIGKGTLFSQALLSARLHPNVSAAYGAVHGRDDVFMVEMMFLHLTIVLLGCGLWQLTPHGILPFLGQVSTWIYRFRVILKALGRQLTSICAELIIISLEVAASSLKTTQSTRVWVARRRAY